MCKISENPNFDVPQNADINIGENPYSTAMKRSIAILLDFHPLATAIPRSFTVSPSVGCDGKEPNHLPTVYAWNLKTG